MDLDLRHYHHSILRLILSNPHTCSFFVFLILSEQPAQNRGYLEKVPFACYLAILLGRAKKKNQPKSAMSSRGALVGGRRRVST